MTVSRAIGCNHRTTRRAPAAGATQRWTSSCSNTRLPRAASPPSARGQVWSWAARGAGGYEQMTNVPAALREALASEVPFCALELREQARSDDGTVKALFATADGRPLEAVLMRYRDGRRSICLSSQSGCPLTCRFCATGSMRFARNLTASEILDQALHFRRTEALDHCVFMGMGEPMLNLDAVLAACERLPRARHHAPAHRRSRPSAGSRGSNGSPTATCRCAWHFRCTPPRNRCARS